jgi:hypothetical protein
MLDNKSNGGEGGIRTPDTGVSPYNGLANSARPLPVARNQSVTPISGVVTRAETGCSAEIYAPKYAPHGKDDDTAIASSTPQLIFCRVSELRPHPSYVKHGLSAPACKIAALDRLGNLAFEDPIFVTQDGLIIDGYARWELAKKRRMATILCLVYQRTEDEALRHFFWRHPRFHGLNDCTRIELGRDLKVDSRKERAQILGVSEGNLSKVDRILEHGSPSTKQAARDREISIRRAAKWSHETVAQQEENLRVLRIERGIRKKARSLVAAISRCKPDEEVLTVAHLLRQLERLSTMSPEQSEEFGPVGVVRLHVPTKEIYVTDGLIQGFQRQQEVLIE